MLEALAERSWSQIQKHCSAVLDRAVEVPAAGSSVESVAGLSAVKAAVAVVKDRIRRLLKRR